MNRRHFIHTSAILCSAPLLNVSGFKTFSSKYKMGLQLFTIRDAMQRDPKETLKQVTNLGYQDLETYGFDPVKIGYYGMTATEFRAIIDDLNLTTTSGHYDLFKYVDASDEETRRYVDACIKGAFAVGHKYITWPWLAPESRTLETFKKLPEKLNRIGEQVTAAGLGFAYHNHDFEFKQYGNETGYDIILKETDPKLVKLQVDLYWVMHSSPKSPVTLINEQPGRFVMWHIKDMDKKTRDYTELGNGSIDYSPILPLAGKAGLQYYYLEQGGNYARSSMDSIAQSAAFFKKNLEHLL